MLRERVVHPRVKVTLLADLTLATTSIVPFTLSIAVAQPPSILILLFLPSTFRRTLGRLFRPGFLLRRNFAASFCHVVGRTVVVGALFFLGQGYPRSRFDRLTGESRSSFPSPGHSTIVRFLVRVFSVLSKRVANEKHLCSSSRRRIRTRGSLVRYDQRGNRIGMKAAVCFSVSRGQF